MSEYLTDEEQIALIKRWLKNYGPAILLGLLLAIGSTLGWQYWQNYKSNQSNQASMLYYSLFQKTSSKETDALLTDQQIQTIAELETNYTHTPYAGLAGLILAKNNVVQNKLPDAAKNLAWVVAHGSTKPIQQIARIELARILIAENQAQNALETLSTVTDASYEGLIAEIKGDAEVALKNPQAARKNYELAKALLPPSSADHQWLDMKLSNLPLS